MPPIAFGPALLCSVLLCSALFSHPLELSTPTPQAHTQTAIQGRSSIYLYEAASRTTHTQRQITFNQSTPAIFPST